MSEQNKQVVRDFFDAVNAHEPDRLIDLMTEDMVTHEEFPGLEQNREGVREFFAMMIAAFPDFKLELERVIAEGDIVVAHSRMTGTQQGEIMGIAATGRPIDVPVVDIVRIQDGRAAEHWGVTDGLVMMQQLGAIPEQAPA